MEMSVVIFGAGIGAIILSVLWIIAVLFCCISLRTRYNLGPVTITIALFVTIILLSVPRKGDEPQTDGEKILDPMFVWRTSTLLFLAPSALISFIYFIVDNIMEVKQARPIRSWHLKT